MIEKKYTYGIKKSHLKPIRLISESSGFFSDEELIMADDVAKEALSKGEEQSGYSYIFFVEADDTCVAFSCFGKIPCTDERYRIYWLAVDNSVRFEGIGSALLSETEKVIAERGGKRIYLETSTREQYQPTRDFYRKCRYIAEAKLENYFYDGDGMVMYSKIIS